MSAYLTSALRNLPSRLQRRTAGAAYRPEIDGLRFLAIAIVVVGHLAERLTRFFPAAREAMDASALGALLQRPGLGVYLFFTVSGFILATQAGKATTHLLSAKFLKTYFARRVLRIEPPYLLLLLATFLFVTASGYRPDGTHQFATAPDSLAASLGASVLYLHDLIWGTYPRLFPPGWSLEVEVQFYLVAPLLFALWFAFPRGRSRVAAGGLGLIVGSVASLVAPASAGPLHIETSLFRYFHFFWLGLVLADTQATLRAVAARAPRVIASAGWGALVLYLLLPNAPDATTPSAFALGITLRTATIACIAAMILAALAPSGSFRRVCARPWISLLGGACYSLYLTHLQILQATASVAAKILPDAGTGAIALFACAQLVAVIVGGLCFYAFVERPFMRPDWPSALRRRFANLAPSAAPAP